MERKAGKIRKEWERGFAWGLEDFQSGQLEAQESGTTECNSDGNKSSYFLLTKWGQ